MTSCQRGLTTSIKGIEYLYSPGKSGSNKKEKEKKTNKLN